MYKKLLRPLLFQLDPETVHELSFRAMRAAAPLRSPILHWLRVDDPRLAQTVWGIPFSNPFGLAGGFDKNARCVDLWRMFGFSFVEIGTVTPRPQAGNPKPRLFRHPDRKAIVNRMGFNNDGAEAIGARLSAMHEKNTLRYSTVGISLGKQKETPAGDRAAVAQDYLDVLERLYAYGDYFAVNVSSPNTPDLRSLQEKDSLRELLRRLVEWLEENKTLDQRDVRKPICVKLAPDLSDAQILEALDVVMELGVDGIIATNTTNQTQGLEQGGLSGAPLRERSTEVIRLLSGATEGKLPIIGCGGVFEFEDALEKLQAGAWLIQVYTGFVYEGPMMIRNQCKRLVHHMEKNEISALGAMRHYRS